MSYTSKVKAPQVLSRPWNNVIRFDSVQYDVDEGGKKTIPRQGN